MKIINHSLMVFLHSLMNYKSLVNCILANCSYLIGTVPIFTQEKVGKKYKC